MFAIIYSKSTGRIRSTILPDNDSDLNNIPLNSGEAKIIFDNSQYGDIHQLQNLLNTKTGLIPANDRYAIVDSLGNVTGIITADPLCGDAITGHSLIQTNQAQVGWTYNHATGFIAPII